MTHCCFPPYFALMNCFRRSQTQWSLENIKSNTLSDIILKKGTKTSSEWKNLSILYAHQYRHIVYFVIYTDVICFLFVYSYSKTWNLSDGDDEKVAASVSVSGLSRCDVTALCGKFNPDVWERKYGALQRHDTHIIQERSGTEVLIKQQQGSESRRTVS